MKKLFIFILTFLVINNLIGTDLSTNLEEISSTLINLENIYTQIKPQTKPSRSQEELKAEEERRLKEKEEAERKAEEELKAREKRQEELDKIDKEFYEQLQEALNNDSRINILKALDKVKESYPRNATTVAQYINERYINNRQIRGDKILRLI